MKFNFFWGIVLCLLFSNVTAQSEQKQIRLLDLDSALPITLATFEYGSQTGTSDPTGVIRFSLEEGKKMTLSHLNYGSWTLDEQALLKAIQEQVFYRKSIAIDLYPVIVIGVKSRNTQPDETLKIQNADRMQHDGAQLLNQLPSFNSIRKGGSYGFDPVFRGFKYDQLNVVLNGAQSATAACPNRMDPPTSQMAPNMMDRIEILKGPYALRYGTGFGATINFVPAKLRFTSEPDLYGRFSTGYESNGEIFRSESQIGYSGETYDLSFFGSWSQGNDYTTGNGNLVQADFQRGSFGVELGFKLNSHQQIRVSTVYNRARDADFPALPMDLREDDTWLFNVRHDMKFDQGKLQNWNSTVFGSFVDHRMDNLLKPLNPRMLNAETTATTYNYGGRTEGVWRFNKGRLYAGADLRIEGAEGTRVREFLMGPMAGNTVEDNAWQDGRISKTGLFTEYQKKGTSFQYIFSGRLELNAAKINDPSSEFVQVHSKSDVTQLNPSFSLGILKDFNSSIKGGLWLGRAQRSGGLTERFINFFPVGIDPFEMLGNPQLDPEVNNQVDLTFQWKSDAAVINVDVFASYLQNYISSIIDPNLNPRLPMSPGVRRFINIDQAFKTGFEISWLQELPAGLQHQLGVAYTYGQDLERDEPLPEIAPLDFRYTLLGRYVEGKLRPELQFRYVAEQSRNSTEFGENATPSFILIDVKTEYQFSDQFILNFGVNNLLDKSYFEHLNRSVRGTNAPILAPGRNLFINLNFEF
jgi:iron complex outermembrane receptor protein